MLLDRAIISFLRLIQNLENGEIKNKKDFEIQKKKKLPVVYIVV